MAEPYGTETPQEYEAPAIVSLGLMDELTHGLTGDSETSLIVTTLDGTP